MMLVTQLRLTSHLLGELRPDHRGIRRFKLDKKGWVAVNQNVWLEKFQLAAHNLQLMVDVRGTVVAPASIMPASIHLYRRVYSKVNVEMFEAFRPGTIVTFDLMLRDDRPKCPSAEQMQQLLAFVGEWEGISQFGSKFGFGRFDVLGMPTQQTRTASLNGERKSKPLAESDGGAPVSCDPSKTESP